uniref:Uncharacterized protein n=1 Tax=Timema cristinae TaxID=61476 RepID=A0A7R9CF52_TIMCR|nr:unnamed protein product [Timema cristinae]
MSLIIVQSGEFVWDGFTQTLVLSGSSIGMFMSYLVSARLCEIFGVKRLVGYAFLVSGILNCLQPTFLRVHVSIYIIGGLIHGLLNGIVLPGFSMLFVRWLEENERLKMGSFVFSVYDTPNKHPRISEEEKSYLTSSIKIDDRIVPIAPWLKILTSSPYWAHISVSLAVAWISFTIGTELPLYLTKVLNYSIEQTSVISALPHLAQLFGNIFSALLSQFIRDKGYLTKIVCYKVFNIVALPHLAQLFGNIFSALLSQFIRDKGYLTKIVCYKVFNIVGPNNSKNIGTTRSTRKEVSKATRQQSNGG